MIPTMTKTLLQQVYDELKYKSQVKNQTDFAAQLGYDNAYVSRLIKSKEPLPFKFQSLLHDKFSFNKKWLTTNGKEGEMFNEQAQSNGAHVAENIGDGDTLNRLMRILEQMQTNATLSVQVNKIKAEADLRNAETFERLAGLAAQLLTGKKE